MQIKFSSVAYSVAVMRKTYVRVSLKGWCQIDAIPAMTILEDVSTSCFITSSTSF